MNSKENFENERKSNVAQLAADDGLKKTALKFMVDSAASKYTYNFNWLGRPIIQYPQDIVALQEIVWTTKPDLIIETGIAHGGSLILSASILELLGHGEVLGIDIDIREHNRIEIEKHPLSKRITMIEGSSIEETVIKKVRDHANGKRVMVILDSNHTHDHVYKELLAYASLVTIDCYLIVFDTAVEDFPTDYNWGERPWGRGDNPKTAVREFLKMHQEFVIDKYYQDKLQITVAPDGYLKRVK